MAKECEIKSYIRDLNISERARNFLNNTHNDVFNKLKDSKSFRYQDGYLFTKKNDYNSSLVAVNTINREYGERVASIVKYAKSPTQSIVKINTSLMLKHFEEDVRGVDFFKNDWGLYEQEQKEDIVDNSAQYQLPQGREIEEYVASEKTIRDLAERMSDRIGIPIKLESDRTKQYKGKLKNNVAYINLAYATLDTPIHEILGHPIIRTIKNNKDHYSILDFSELKEDGFIVSKNNKTVATFKSKKEAEDYVNINSKENPLYQNLLKELEYGIGKDVLDRVKRDYNIKTPEKIIRASDMLKIKKGVYYEGSIQKEGYIFSGLKYNEEIIFGNYMVDFQGLRTTEFTDGYSWQIKGFQTEKEAQIFLENLPSNITPEIKYTTEEQQEEAIVELLGMYTADRLNKVKDGKLISLLKRLLKEMKAFMKSLFNQKEVDIDSLPDEMTLGDIADLLAYSNSKLILPGYEVIYTTPDNQQFKTYVEVSKHLSELSNLGDIDLYNIDINSKVFLVQWLEGIIDYDSPEDPYGNFTNYIRRFSSKNEAEKFQDSLLLKGIDSSYIREDPIQKFIQKNKEYEQSKEIIEEWKKVNDIKYDPEEVYSRGQGFYSVVGAYSDFDVNLMFQNLLQHIEDNEKAGGEFTVSAFTKPIDRQIGHLEGGGGKIKFKIFPKSEDIKWAANTDAYSGSVWDASEKVNKDKKSEIIGVSYTKSPSLRYINSVQPNLASIIDNLQHHHNELGISLTGNNFEIEVDNDVPYSTKRIIENINNILQQRRLMQIDRIIENLEKDCK